MIKKIMFAVSLILTVSACSSGSSSSGGSSSEEIGGRDYSGQGTVRVKGDGVDESYTENINISINGNQVRIEVEEYSNTGTLNGNVFSVPISISRDLEGYDCEGTLQFDGRVNGDVINGTLSGGNKCDVLGITILRADNSGTFRASAQ